ncbi:hypothetical protein L596_018190 [Steinernema carpocapsae]|uniref:Uncharacterized protein n=1 Tax=Steinernema carpocapsae TaxID=34508 RepID=A0A4U5N4A4_STECR|nr:hypothetical protein L596_018190 [Steinernema carpocapsae]
MTGAGRAAALCEGNRRMLISAAISSAFPDKADLSGSTAMGAWSLMTTGAAAGNGGGIVAGRRPLQSAADCTTATTTTWQRWATWNEGAREQAEDARTERGSSKSACACAILRTKQGWKG